MGTGVPPGGASWPGKEADKAKNDRTASGKHKRGVRMKVVKLV